MKKINFKQRIQEIRFITEHSLSQDQYNKLVEEKAARAKQSQQELKQREASIRRR